MIWEVAVDLLDEDGPEGGECGAAVDVSDEDGPEGGECGAAVDVSDEDGLEGGDGLTCEAGQTCVCAELVKIRK